MKQKQLQKMASQTRKLDIGSITQFLNKHGSRYESKVPPQRVVDFLANYPLRAFPLAQCRSNAVRLARDAAAAGLCVSYVEGLARHAQGYREQLHAWTVIQSALVDPTWGELIFEWRKTGIYAHRRGRIIGVIPSGYEYHGMEIPIEAALESDKFIIGRDIYHYGG